MSETSIQWTDYTFNPWWGCTRVSPGCEHCYAETFSHRLGMDLWGPTAGRRFFDDKHWNEPLRWQARRRKGDQRHRVFCASMADVFEANPALDDVRAGLFRLIEETPDLTWQLLTKRPENMLTMAPESWANGWPANVWAMTTAEDQKRADERIPVLLRVPAKTRGVSYEPALGPVCFTPWLYVPTWCRACGTADDAHYDPNPGGLPNHPLRPNGCLMGAPNTGEPGAVRCSRCGSLNVDELAPLDWIIVGGESGPGARPFDVAWARSTVEQCKAAGVAAFVKQLGARPVSSDGQDWIGHRLDVRPTGNGLETKQHLHYVSKKGGDPSEWPEDIRVREFPT